MTSPGYVILDPGPDLRAMPDVAWHPSMVDYDKHEAYRDLAQTVDLKTRLSAGACHPVDPLLLATTTLLARAAFHNSRSLLVVVDVVVGRGCASVEVFEVKLVD